MRLPHHKYLLYLTLTKHTDQEIRDLIQLATGRDESVAYLNRIRKDNLHDPADTVLADFLKKDDVQLLTKLHRQDVPPEWVDRLGLQDIHANTEEFRRAYEIFSSHRKYHYINLYVLCMDSTPERLVEIYNKRFNESLELNHLLVYVAYFADFESMRAIDWDKFLIKLEPQTRTLYEIAPGRKIPYIQWRMGDKVDINPETVTHTLMADFFHLSRDEYDTSSRRDGWAERSVKFASLALSAQDRVRTQMAPTQTTKSLIMLFEEKAGQIANYSEVSTGNDSGEPENGVPDPEPDPDDNEEAV